MSYSKFINKSKWLYLPKLFWIQAPLSIIFTFFLEPISAVTQPEHYNACLIVLFFYPQLLPPTPHNTQIQCLLGIRKHITTDYVIPAAQFPQGSPYVSDLPSCLWSGSCLSPQDHSIPFHASGILSFPLLLNSKLILSTGLLIDLFLLWFSLMVSVLFLTTQVSI